MNEYFYGLAQQAANASARKGLDNIDPRWIYVQWEHETGGFTSDLQASNHNLGGLTQSEPNDTPQPDGNCYYMNFDTFEGYADYFGRYLRYYKENGIAEAQTLTDYIIALKSGGYFGDSLENYLSDCQQIYTENFGE